MLNPNTKRREPKKIRPRDLENPAANATYQGTSGSTHGETNEISPASIAIGNADRRNPSIKVFTTKSVIPPTPLL